jgi:hypothetical protein
MDNQIGDEGTARKINPTNMAFKKEYVENSKQNEIRDVDNKEVQTEDSSNKIQAELTHLFDVLNFTLTELYQGEFKTSNQVFFDENTLLISCDQPSQTYVVCTVQLRINPCDVIKTLFSPKFSDNLFEDPIFQKHMLQKLHDLGLESYKEITASSREYKLNSKSLELEPIFEYGLHEFIFYFDFQRYITQNK